MQKRRDQENIRSDPGHGAGEAGCWVAENWHQAHAGEGSGEHFKDTGQDGEGAETHALDGEAHHVHEHQGDVEQAVSKEEQGYIPDGGYLVSVQEQESQVLAEQGQNDEGGDGVDAADEQSIFHALLHAVDLPGAHILPGPGGHGGAQGVKGAGEEQGELVAGGDGGHVQGAQAVDGGLQDHAADGGDGVLQPHGDADAAEDFRHAQVELPLLPGHAQDGEMGAHVEEAEHAGDGLGDHCGVGGSLHAHAHDQDGEQVQENVDDGGEQQEVHRRPAVPQGADDAGQNVVEVGDRDSRKNDEYVVVGSLYDIIRGIHPSQNVHAEEADDEGHDGGEDGGQPAGVGNKTPQSVMVPGPEPLGHGDGEAAAHAGAEADDHEVYGAGGAHGGQGAHPQVLSHDDGVHHAVKLLKQKAHEHGHGKAQDQPEGGSCRHIPNFTFRHIGYLFFLECIKYSRQILSQGQHYKLVFGDCIEGK